jgi:DNA-binding response OmpR family regulator
MKKKILLVDDNPAIRMLLEKFLGQTYTVIPVEDGIAAMKWLQENKAPDLMIADLQMPGMSGKEIVTQVRASGYFKEIPVLILSGSEKSDDRIDVLRKGADDFLLKPFNPEELLVRIENLLRRYSLAS